ncbi:T-cell immunomodulatory protein [Aplysia californica]|uniref:T-cell immunomodulatory protein n=1 Tax=Aplysia californica TaxID=6500 RepID=A0ABM0JDR3_APLCA|nr:T-cell immunomodulatory protein [Aplysia californica]
MRGPRLLSIRFSLVFSLAVGILYLPLAFSSLSDVTVDVFGRERVYGIVSAFGDLDADKATDVFVLSEDGKSVFILEADIDIDLRKDFTEFKKRTFIEGKPEDAVITSVVPGDFNSDSQMDVLVTRKPKQDSTEVTVEIYPGNGAAAEKPLTLTETFRDQPVVIDWNGDMIPDLFGETADGRRAVWIFVKNGSYAMEYVTNGTEGKLPQLRVPQSSAFLDLDGDLTADLCAVSSVGGQVSFEFWLNQAGNLTWVKSISAPASLKHVGQASFVDFNGNHETNIVLPGCLDEECKEAAIFVWTNNKYTEGASGGKWHRLDVNFKPDENHQTSFEKTINPTSWLSLPIMLRMGDFNHDGYPDAVAVLKETHAGSTNMSSFLMYNERCGTDKCEGFSRTLSIDYGQPLHKHKPVIAAFFDLMENGALDILLSEVTGDNRVFIRAIEQDFNGDASFLKVLVVSGLCHSDCPNDHQPYGVNQVGPTAKFESTNPSGGEQIGIASQLTQSAYFSLQLPFMLFGLGRTPNFVDELEVGIPYPSGQSPRRHSWSTIIPNSHVIVVPYPVSSPGSWKHELYITPSRLVLLTGVSLLGTCAFIAIIVGLLQWRERMEDKREKLQEAQRFHFDAM